MTVRHELWPETEAGARWTVSTTGDGAVGAVLSDMRVEPPPSWVEERLCPTEEGVIFL